MVTKQSILLGSAADCPTEKDSLGFQPYIESVATFLESSNTQPPLAISIEGEWGAGKSSFMRMLKNRLARPDRQSGITTSMQEAKSAKRNVLLAALHGLLSKFHEPPRVFIEFNAWRHDKEDALWAAFALTCTRELKKSQPVQRRIAGWVRLLFSRLKGFSGWLQLAKLTVVTALWIILFVSVPTLLWLKGSDWTAGAVRHLAGTSDNASGNTKAVTVGGAPRPVTNSSSGFSAAAAPIANSALMLMLNGGVLGLWAAVLILGGAQLKKFGSPLEADLQKILTTPEYEGKTAFVERFHRDFSKILDAYCKSQRLYIFIDDLDRCEVPKAADLMQAINLMINEDPRLVFIIGMDREKVAASIVAKYATVLQYVEEIDPAAPMPEKLAFGYRFLEKFIQIQFKLPQPRIRNLKLFARDLGSQATALAPPTFWSLLFDRSGENVKLSSAADAISIQDEDNSKVATINRLAVDIQIDQDSELILEAIEMVAPVLNYNPRRLKQFINLFRLSAFIANKLYLFDELDGKPVMTFPQLAKFIAISMKWPMFTQQLEHDQTLLSTLFQSSMAETASQQGWLGVSRFVYLMRYGCRDSDGKPTEDADAYSLDRLDPDSLLAVTAPAVRPKAPNQNVRVSKRNDAAQDIQRVVEKAANEPEMESPSSVDATTPSASFLNLVSQLARDYEDTRENMGASDERTAKMTAIVRSARRVAGRVPDAKYPLSLFFTGESTGDRVIAIGIAQGRPPESMYFPLCLEGIANAKSAFEQFHALSLADMLIETLDAEQRVQLRAALFEQHGVVIDEKDRSRWELRNSLLRKLADIVPVTSRAARA